VTGPEDPRPGADWDAFRAARDRFLARVRPESMDDPPPLICPDAVPEVWPGRADGPGPQGGEPPPRP
jgi:hypothetical protein